MAESERGKAGTSGVSVILSAWHDPAARILNVDLLAVLLAILLPWSTTGVVIVAVLWIVALAFTLEVRAFLQSLARPISALPIAFVALALVGTLWSDAPWGARLAAISPTAKLLLLPLLFYHFDRSRRGEWVFIAFLSSCTLLMAMSWLVALVPSLSLKHYLSLGPFAPAKGIVVKNYIDQSQELALCAVALAYPIMALFRANKTRLAILFTFIALSFLANMIFVVVSRTTLVAMPIMLMAFALRHLKPRTGLIASIIAALVAVAAWSSSPDLRNTTSKFFNDYRISMTENDVSGVGSRLVFWQKSLGFVSEAPVIGHGTGATRSLFERAAIGKAGVQAEIVGNPHNQTLNVAVQWGAIGIVILYAMWIFHLLLFRGDGLAAWVGLLVVVQNVLTSMFNSHLFDFHEGWMYVLGVGVAGGMVLGAGRTPHLPNPFAATQTSESPRVSGGFWLSRAEREFAVNIFSFGKGRIADPMAVALWSIAMIWLALATGAQHDYIYYLDQWGLVLSGADPWGTENAYGPVHNVLAYLLRVDPFAPKLLIVSSVLVANWLLLREIYALREGRPLYGLYLLIVPANFLVISMAITYGLNDALVAALVVFAIITRYRGHFIVSGVFLGLAVLLKFYPIILVPMFALDAGRFRLRLISAAAAITLTGMMLAAVVWGDAIMRPFTMAAERDPTLMSILMSLSFFPSLIGGQAVLDFLVKTNVVFVAFVALLSTLISWKIRMHWLEASVLGLLAVLLVYKVGHQQFYLTWLFLVAALPLAGTESARRLMWICLPLVLFLSAFQWGYAYGTDRYRSVLGVVRQDVGFLAFALSVATIATYFVLGRRGRLEVRQ